MNFVKTIATGLARTVKVAKIKTVNASPKLLAGVGGVLIVGGVVTACKETLKAEEIFDEFSEKKEKIDKVTELGASEDSEVTYTKKDRLEDLTRLYLKTCGKLAKVYWPAMAMVGGGIGLMLLAHGILSKRNAALALTCEGLGKAKREFEKRVRDKYGDEEFENLKYGLETFESEVTEDDGTVVKKKERIADGSYIGEESYFFDQFCNGWTRFPDINKSMLVRIQNDFNDVLERERFVMLCDVKKMVGLPLKSTDFKKGWIYDPSNPRKIDFGIFNSRRPGARDFVNGIEPTVLLDFNVDPGFIVDKIDLIPWRA